MIKSIKIILITFVLGACNSSKLKIYNAHSVKEDFTRKKNFYLKDKNRSFEFLKGTWVWSNNNDTLTLNIKAHYKKPYDSKIFNYENAYYDSSIIHIKYVHNGKVVYNDLDEELKESCLYASNFEIYTDMFRLIDRCDPKFTGAYLVFMNDFNSLSFLGRATDTTTLLKKEDEYEVVIPNSIVLDRVIE